MLKNNNYTQKYKRTGLSSCSFLSQLYQVMKESTITPPPKNEIILCAIATVVAVILVYGS